MLSDSSSSSKSYFLGFMSYCSHDPSAALIELVQFGEEVKCNFVHFEEGMLSRRKKSYHFPTRSIAACLDYFDIELSDVNQVITDYMDDKSYVGTSLNFRQLVGDYIRKNLNLSSGQIATAMDHHEAHAMSAWVGSGFKDAAFLSIDGLGSKQSTHSVYVTDVDGLRKVFTQTTPGIGSLYGLITELIGFKSGEEGKTMGLAPYGRHLKKINGYPKLDFKGVYSGLSVDYSKVINRSPNKYLLTDFGLKDWPQENLYKDFRTYLAFSIQEELEKCILHLAQEIKKITGKLNICISGGVGLNCVMNEILVNSEIFNNVYVFPDSADSGLPTGLAFEGVRRALHKNQWYKLLDSYKHPKFSSEKAVPIVESTLIDSLPWEKVDVNFLLDQLDNRSVIAVFDGGYEYGPRALGRRSFLANPRFPEMKQILNEKIKHREEYRPFAPICLKSDFSIFFESKHVNHEFMSYAVKAKSLALKLLPAIVHEDGTSRVQIATEECGLVHELLIGLKERTGYGILINTSFNDNDEPIVLDKIDAVSCFLRTNSDVLVLGERMLIRGKIDQDIKKLSEKIRGEINNKNTIRFMTALNKLLRNKVESVNEFISENLKISEFYTKDFTRIKLIKLISEVKFGSQQRFKRVLVSTREKFIFNKILNDYLVNSQEFTDEVIFINDDQDSLKNLKKGDLVISYNLSNIIRDTNIIDTLTAQSIVNFYNSNDFPLKCNKNLNLLKKHIISDLVETYENNNLLSIREYFSKFH